jgi:superfamily II DNA/RNA helicase
MKSDDVIAMVSQGLAGQVSEKLLLSTDGFNSVPVETSAKDDHTSALRLAKENVIWCPDDKDRKRRLFALLQDKRKLKPPVVVFVNDVVGASMLSDTIRERVVGCRSC